MKRKIIKIDAAKCNGCGLCAQACHEDAIFMVDGKAKLLKDDYCDGLGDCLPACPAGAITFEEREAAAYDEAAVKARQSRKAAENPPEEPLACGCPGTHSRSLERSQESAGSAGSGIEPPAACPAHPAAHHGAFPAVYHAVPPASELRQWPVQIKLVPAKAPYFNNAHLLVAADCAAYASGAFHGLFMKNKITIIGCPKLDNIDYTEKLTEIIANNNIKSVTVVRMEVPCCGGIEHAVVSALKNSGKYLQWKVYTLSTEGNILED